ncbi:alpha/beta hydrolase [soil metagenome]
MSNDAPELRPTRPLRRLILRLAAMAMLLYLGVCLLIYALQTQLIFPGQDTQGTAFAQVRPGPDSELVRLSTANGVPVVGLFGPAKGAEGRVLDDASARPTMLYFYGNGMCLASSLDWFEEYRRIGLNVLIVDYVGYGLSGGSPSEANCYATADAAWAHLQSRPDIDPARIIVGGWSLGGALAVDLAAREPVAGLVVLSSFSSMAEMAASIYPWLPVRLLLRHRFDSLSKMPQVTCPALIGHGEIDPMIPAEMSDRLAASAGGPVRQFVAIGAGHNDFYLIGRDLILEEVERFVAGPVDSEAP